jgi:succinyldiaminopimelate transaminase
VRALPDFPWDSLAPFKERASAVPGGIVDLSIGTPVDPTPAILQEALRAAADAPGYPQTWGTPDLREAVATWFEARRGVPGLDPAGVIPTIGSKELVAWLPTLLDLGPGDIVGFPRVAYPTYDVGARLAGATPLPVDALTSLGPLTPSTTPKLLWLNTPGNPTGKVLGVEHLRKVVDWARGHGVIVASDECYAELDWRDRSDPSIADWRREPPTTPSLLDPRVTGGSHEGLLVCYSLSKQSNLAGYRRATLKPAVERWGLRVDDSEAGLYLWATAGEDSWTTVGRLAELGILAAPGAFYGTAGAQHVRIALTGTDERIATAAARLGA